MKKKKTMVLASDKNRNSRFFDEGGLLGGKTPIPGFDSVLGGLSGIAGNIFDNLSMNKDNSFEVDPNEDAINALNNYQKVSLDKTNVGQSTTNGVLSGASAGSIAGPLGAGIGAAVGGIGSLVSGIFGNKKRKRQERKLNESNISKLLGTAEGQYNNSSIARQSSSFAYGGDFNNGVTEFNSGSSHEASPIGGIPQGFDEDGNPNLVEKDEVKYNNFIYSNRLYLDDLRANELNLPKGMIGKTYAKAAGIAQKESEERPYDWISKNGLDDSMAKLAAAQEDAKSKRENTANNLFANGGSLNQRMALAQEKTSKQLIPGGEADLDYIKHSTEEPDPYELAMGISVEMEHTNSRKKSREIALDHLKETPDYYTRLYGSGLADEEISPEEINLIEQRLADIGPAEWAFNPKVTENMKAEGGGIHIDKNKRGTFTAAATKHGKGVQEFASQVLGNKENYSAAIVKKANFARNAAKLHDYGGYLEHELSDPANLNDNFGYFANGGQMTRELVSLIDQGYYPEVTPNALLKKDVDLLNIHKNGGQMNQSHDLYNTFAIGGYLEPNSITGFNINNPSIGTFDRSTLVPQKQSSYSNGVENARRVGTNNTNIGDNASYLRYASPIANLGLGIEALLSSPEQISANNYSITPQQISGRMSYDPIDRNYIANQLRAQDNSIRRNIINTSGGNRGAAQAALLAQGYNVQRSMADAYFNVDEANYNRLSRAQEFNRQTDMFNAQAQQNADQFNVQSRFNIDNLNLQNRAARRNAIRNSISALTGDLMGIGSEGYSRNVASSLPFGYQSDIAGNISYKNKRR